MKYSGLVYFECNGDGHRAKDCPTFEVCLRKQWIGGKSKCSKCEILSHGGRKCMYIGRC